MGSSYFSNPAIFLVETVFNLYVLAVMLRFLLQWVNADFYNPISQFLVRITHPPLRLLRRAIPSIGHIDTASVVFMLALQMLLGFLIFSLKGMSVSPVALFVWALVEIFSLLINVFVFAILIRVILSWVNPASYNAAVMLVNNLTDPMLQVVRNIIPAIGGIDLSPLVVLIALQLIKMVLFPPLLQVISILG